MTTSTSPSKIPSEAVEAAAKGLFAYEQCDRMQKLDLEGNWRGRLNDKDREEYRQLALSSLEAAAPYLMSAAWDEGFEAGDMPCETAIPCGDCPTCNTPAPTNPYRPTP